MQLVVITFMAHRGCTLEFNLENCMHPYFFVLCIIED